MKKEKRKFISNALCKHLSENKIKYIIFSLCVIFGVILGSLSGMKSTLENTSIENFLSVYKLQGVINHDVFINSSIVNMRYICCLFVSGFFIWLVPIGTVALISKGYSIGFSIVYFIKECGINGFLFSCVTMTVANIIILPLSVMYMVYQFNFSIHTNKFRKNSGNYKELKKMKINNVLILSAVILIGLLCGLFESSLTPLLINIIYGNHI